MAKKEIKTYINITASPSVVWKVLTDFEKYPSWNPFLKLVEGDFEVGNKIKIMAGEMKFQPKVLVFDNMKEIRWLGKLLVKGLFDGEHIFQIVNNNDGSVTFKHDEKFSGLLVGLFAKKLDKETKQGFQAMNQKLKEICEHVPITS